MVLQYCCRARDEALKEKCFKERRYYVQMGGVQTNPSLRGALQSIQAVLRGMWELLEKRNLEKAGGYK